MIVGTDALLTFTGLMLTRDLRGVRKTRAGRGNVESGLVGSGLNEGLCISALDEVVDR